MSSSSSSSHATITYTSVSSDYDGLDFGIPLVELRISHYSASPTAHSPDYVVNSEPTEDDPKEDPEEDLAYYPSKEEEEDEEPLALANSASPVPNSVP
ncbi:hypothetical protein Tco_0113256, partial [Tanacetum coccineum]